jgi:gas vesicle protein
MKLYHLALATLGGAAVGAAAALLLAPQKGSDTREAIKNYIKCHCKSLNCNCDKLNDIADKIANEIQSEK